MSALAISDRTSNAAVAIILSLTLFLFFSDQPPADLMAIYLAGEHFQAGLTDQIYPARRALFDLSVPSSWHSAAQEYDLEGMTLFPFIYPPLWAAVFGEISSISSPQTVFAVARMLNAAMIVGCAALTWRILRPAMRLDLWMIAATFLVGVTMTGYVALSENQPQIFVSFLILLALERSRAGAPIFAGAALALAASIKIYPILFILLWIARKNRPAVGSAIVFGALLAGSSVYLCGWDLHLIFLDQLRIISDTVLLTKLNPNISAFLAHLFMLDQMQPLASAVQINGPEGYFAAKPPILAVISGFGLLVVLGVFYGLSKNQTATVFYSQICPAFFIFLSFFSPLSWAYHYLTAACFFPLLFMRGPHSVGFWFSTVFFILYSFPVASLLIAPSGGYSPVQLIGSLGFLGSGILLLKMPLHLTDFMARIRRRPRKRLEP